MSAIMLSPANLALCLASLTQWIVSGSLVGSPHRTLHVESQFLAVNRGVEAFDPFAEEHFYGKLKCGVTVQVGSADHKFEMCPEECPYYAQDLDDDLHCSFVCVPATECGTRNPKRPIADVIKGHKTCRGPMVSDCEDYNYDGTDSCAKCQWLYSVGPDGLCHFDHPTVIWVVIVVFAVVVVFLLIWVIDCCVRTSTNKPGLAKGEKFRSLQKVRQSRGPQQGHLFPMNSKLWQVDVAGPGMLLHFRMQIFIIVWAAIVGIIWLCMAVVIDNALFILGTRRFGTPRENCILVAWGYETQQRLMWTKVMFLVITYIFTFFFSLWHAIEQKNVFDGLDEDEKTMKDFMAFLTGLPSIKATVNAADAEVKVKKHLEEKGYKGIVGVSIAWNYSQDVDEVDALKEKLMLVHDEKYQRDRAVKTGVEGDQWQVATTDDDTAAQSNPIRRVLYSWELKLAAGDPDEFEEKLPKDNGTNWEERRLERLKLLKEKINDVLAKIESSEDAFVVFETEDLKNEALLKAETDGCGEMDGNTLNLEEVVCEPDTIKWENYGNSSLMARLGRFCTGFGFILLALFFWTTVFYAPYAYQVFCFNYDNGAQPPFTLALTFCMVVVLGNAIMYEVCGRVSDFIGFKTRDQRESCYLILYVIACMFNVCLDMVTTYFLAEYILDGLGFRTYYGKKILDVPTFTERFETYAMQRMLAENTKAYSFPATFLIPFLIEPFVTVIVPYYLGKVMVRTHKEWVGRDAELIMAAFEFDMGRYGDLLLDMVLGILIFFFPGGYTLILFFGMAGSHAYIYWFDHCRVIRSIPKCIYASDEVDWWGCWMMAPITALIPMCLVFKANCQDYGFCMKGLPLVESMWLAWALHTVFHTVILRWVVPIMATNPRKPAHQSEEGAAEGKEESEKNFMEKAKDLPCTWFTANPIHCFRSLVDEQNKTESDYCNYCTLGKEHLLNKKPAVNAYYDGEEGEGEVFEDFSASMKGFLSKKKDPKDDKAQQ